MKVEYLPSFIKAIKALKSSSSYKRIKALVFDDIPTYDCLEEIPNLKMLKGEDNAYRIRLGDYRIGFFFEKETVIFARVRHRKEIYRVFP